MNLPQEVLLIVLGVAAGVILPPVVRLLFPGTWAAILAKRDARRDAKRAMDERINEQLALIMSALSTQGDELRRQCKSQLVVLGVIKEILEVMKGKEINGNIKRRIEIVEVETGKITDHMAERVGCADLGSAD